MRATENPRETLFAATSPWKTGFLPTLRFVPFAGCLITPSTGYPIGSTSSTPTGAGPPGPGGRYDFPNRRSSMPRTTHDRNPPQRKGHAHAGKAPPDPLAD